MLRKIILGGFVSICLFAFTSCKNKKEETPSPVVSYTESANEFVIDGQGYSKQLFKIDTTAGLHPGANAIHYTGSGISDSLMVNIFGSAMINGNPQGVSTRIFAIYSGLRTYDLANGNDHCMLRIEFYNYNNSGYTNYVSYRSISGSLTISKADMGGQIEGTYAGTFECEEDPSRTFVVTDGKFSAYLGQLNN